MKRMKRAARIISATCLAATLLCGTCFNAFGASTADLDLSRAGRISLSLYSDEAEAAVTNGTLTLYEVADLTLANGDMAYVKTDAFSGYEGSLDVEEAGVAESLAEYVTEYGVAGTEMEIAEDGSVEFTDLTLGLYLIVQTTESGGYYPIDSFLVTVPFAQGSVWAYSVEASPKVEVYPSAPGTETETPPGMETETPPGSDTTDTETTPGTGTTETETTPGTDTGETETVTPPGTETPDKTETVPAPTTTPTASSTGSKLPQTGQLVWPIILFAVCGGSFFLIGGVMRRKERRVA